MKWEECRHGAVGITERRVRVPCFLSSYSITSGEASGPGDEFQGTHTGAGQILSKLLVRCLLVFLELSRFSLLPSFPSRSSLGPNTQPLLTNSTSKPSSKVDS